MVACKQWDVRIHHVSGTTYIPQIYWHDKWTPICGHYFSENRVGARTFCNKLGYFDGSIVQENVRRTKKTPTGLESVNIAIRFQNVKEAAMKTKLEVNALNGHTGRGNTAETVIKDKKVQHFT